MVKIPVISYVVHRAMHIVQFQKFIATWMGFGTIRNKENWSGIHDQKLLLLKADDVRFGQDTRLSACRKRYSIAASVNP